MGASGAVEVLHAKELAAFESAEEKAKFVAEKEQEYRDKFSNPYNAAPLRLYRRCDRAAQHAFPHYPRFAVARNQTFAESGQEAL